MINKNNNSKGLDDLSDKEKTNVANTWSLLDKFLKDKKIIDNDNKEKESNKKKSDNSNLIKLLGDKASNFKNMDEFNKSTLERGKEILDDKKSFEKIIKFMKGIKTGLSIMEKRNNGVLKNKDFLFVLISMLIYAEAIEMIKIITKKDKI